MLSLSQRISLLQKSTKKVPASFFETLLSNTPDLIFAKDEDFNIVYANPAFLELYPPDQRPHVIGTYAAEGFSEEDAKVFLAEDRKALEKGYTEIVEEVRDYAGRTRTLRTKKIRFFHERTGKPHVLGVATDISSFVEREKLLAKSNLALENFAAMAAHDLRSPLGSISASLEAIESDPETKLGPKSINHFQLIQNCLEGLMDQVSNLLSATKGGDGESEWVFTECDVSTLFEEVRFNLSTKIHETNAKVLSSPLPRLKVNKSLFRQLIHNLIENSLKYRSQNTPIVILRYRLYDGQHCFSVEDNGIGVKPEDRQKIFGLYSQVDKSAPGAGIGLSLCKNIVELHGGRIRVDDYYGPGCRICFDIPTSLAKH